MMFSFKKKKPEITIGTGFEYIIRKVLKRKDMVILLILLGIFILITIMAPMISSHDPNAIDLKNKNLGPTKQHPLGTDYLGRDTLSRILAGAYTSLSISFGVVIISLIIGVMIGCISGYCGGIIDDIVSRVIDIFMSFPSIIFALAVLGALGPGILNMIISIAMVQWSTYARLMRGQVLSVKKKEYIDSAVTMGVKDIHIMTRHIIPNSIAPIITVSTIDIGHVILSVAALSYLGIGLPADVPEWGAMLSAGKEFMRVAPLMTIFPGLAITFIVAIFSMLGDGMRDIFDPVEGGELH
jgi:peptide/nickel transport system permease protein